MPRQSDLSKKIVSGMIVFAKLSLFLLWLMAFLITCLVMSVTFPFVVLFDRLRTIPKGVALS